MAHQSLSPSPPLNRLAFLSLLLLTLAATLDTLRRYWPLADNLWYSSQHDRNLHYLQGLTIATSIRQFDLPSLLSQINRIDVWGILHPLMLAAIQLPLGPDYRLAILPSLLMWAASALFAFLLARQTLPQYANFAGLVAALLLLASPAHRAFATDVMLESTGACLSLAILFFYTLYVQTTTRKAALALTISCVLLFFHKYNYWLLIFLSLTLAETLRHRAPILATLRNLPPKLAPLLRSALRQPLLYIIAPLFALGIYSMLTGPLHLTLAQRSLTLEKPHKIFNLAWLFLCLQIALWYFRTGKSQLQKLPPNLRLLLLGQFIPAALWFLLPRRLGAFLWFLSPANTDQSPAHTGPIRGLHFYTTALLQDYLPAPSFLLASLLLLLIAIAALSLKRLRPGSTAIFIFLAISSLLTITHPMLKNRFLHSWIALAFVAAAIGLALTLSALAKLSPRATRLAAPLLLASLATFLAPSIFSTGHADEGGPHPNSPALLHFTQPYLPHLLPSDRVQFLCTDYQSFSLLWTHLERFRSPALASLDIPNYTPASQNPQTLQAWLASTPADAIVLLELTPSSPFFTGFGKLDYAPLKSLLANDPRFTLVHQWHFPKNETLTLWKRRPAPPSHFSLAPRAPAPDNKPPHPPHSF